ncbi:GNAT family N-acetyltransferase [Rhizobium sp. RAF56]|jgi:RimJ/RimL family protein N-acetyltransferase|uniref:GNAT family N-acetyltransferase n=1 Tax=Rhizobium sp. RAF56 TaxID=3233062 RepID=UPI003F9B477C
MTDIPTIETERLILRPHTISDFDAYAAMWREPGVFRFIGGVAMSREESWTRLLRTAGVWHFLGFGFLVVEERSSGRFLGEAGFHDLRRDMHPSPEGSMEAGWALCHSAQGRGYATEAMRALLSWAGTHFPHARTTCIIAPDNRPSLNVADKLGFRELARTVYHDADIILLELQETAPA